MSGSWAHGRTAATDERIARPAAGHRGLTYARRTPPEQCRWRRGRRAVVGPIPWSARFAYGIGLLATDGWVTTRRGGQPGHVGSTSKDKALVESFLSSFELTNHIRERDRDGHVHFETNTGKVAIFEWARTIGIHPRKSRTIASPSVPDELLPHVVRGLLDGDGSVTWSRRGPRGDQFQVRFHSASRPHLDRLRARSHPLTTTAGSLTVRGALCRSSCAAPRAEVADVDGLSLASTSVRALLILSRQPVAFQSALEVRRTRRPR